MSGTASRRSFTGGVLGALSPQARERLLGRAMEISCPRGGTLYRSRQSPRCALVLTGLLRVYMTSSDGRQVTVRYARPGDLLGVAVALAGPTDVSVQALSDATLLMLDAQALRDEGEKDGRVAFAMAQELGARLYETLEHVAINAFGSVRERIAVHLLRVATPGRQGQPVANLTQQELADAVGTAREVVARVLRQFREAGLVRSRPGGVVLLAPDSLRTLAGDEGAV